jgi:hypothetical protein
MRNSRFATDRARHIYPWKFRDLAQIGGNDPIKLLTSMEDMMHIEIHDLGQSRFDSSLLAGMSFRLPGHLRHLPHGQ